MIPAAISERHMTNVLVVDANVFCHYTIHFNGERSLDNRE
jgi:hypothetical protein